MLPREFAVLMYLKWKGEVTERKLLKKFPTFERKLSYYISPYIDKRNITEELSEEKRDRYIEENLEAKIPISDFKIPDFDEEDNPDAIWYRLNHSGEEYIWEQERKFLGFILPWGITTLIAAASLYAQFTH